MVAIYLGNDHDEAVLAIYFGTIFYREKHICFLLRFITSFYQRCNHVSMLAFQCRAVMIAWNENERFAITLFTSMSPKTSLFLTY